MTAIPQVQADNRDPLHPVDLMHAVGRYKSVAIPIRTPRHVHTLVTIHRLVVRFGANTISQRELELMQT